jgi:hypothetical protein
MKIFIDDERDPSENDKFDVIIRNSSDALYLFNTFIKSQNPIIKTLWKSYFDLIGDFEKISYISFDHDLGQDSENGLSIAKSLVDVDIDFNILADDFKFYVHSQNPVGKENIEKYLSQYLLMKRNKDFE